jgi:hypothetical protein
VSVASYLYARLYVRPAIFSWGKLIIYLNKGEEMVLETTFREELEEQDLTSVA